MFAAFYGYRRFGNVQALYKHVMRTFDVTRMQYFRHGKIWQYA